MTTETAAVAAERQGRGGRYRAGWGAVGRWGPLWHLQRRGGERTTNLVAGTGGGEEEGNGQGSQGSQGRQGQGQGQGQGQVQGKGKGKGKG